MSILEFSNLKYSYDGKQGVLKGISGQMELGKMYAILGPSGCGKTTLLSLLGGLDTSAAATRSAPATVRRTLSAPIC